jgi:hypothetical protein
MNKVQRLGEPLHKPLHRQGGVAGHHQEGHGRLR